MFWLIPFLMAVFILPLLFGAWAWFEVIERMQEEAERIGKRTLTLRGLLITNSAAFLVGGTLLMDPDRAVRLATEGGLMSASLFLPVALPWFGFAAIGFTARMGRRTVPRRVRIERSHLQNQVAAQREAGVALVASLAAELRAPLEGIQKMLQQGRPLPDWDGAPINRDLSTPARPDGWLLAELQRVDRLLDEMDGMPVADREAPTASLHEAFAAVLRPRRDWIEDRGSELIYSAADHWLALPPDDLRQLLTSLVEQAIASAPFGEGVVRITSQVCDGAVQVWITDNGPGIAQAAQERAFDFRATVEDRLGRPLEQGGAGLALSRRLARRWGGDAWVDDADEGGCAWSFRLPVAEPVGPADDGRPSGPP